MHLYPSKFFKLTNEKLFSNRLTFMIFLRQNEIDTAIFSLEVVRHNHDRRETIQVIYIVGKHLKRLSALHAICTGGQIIPMFRILKYLLYN